MLGRYNNARRAVESALLRSWRRLQNVSELQPILNAFTAALGMTKNDQSTEGFSNERKILKEGSSAERNEMSSVSC